MATTLQINIKNELLGFIVDQVQPNKKGHLIIDKPKHCILLELQRAGLLETLSIDGLVVDVVYNSALIRFVNQGGFASGYAPYE